LGRPRAFAGARGTVRALARASGERPLPLRKLSFIWFLERAQCSHEPADEHGRVVQIPCVIIYLLCLTDFNRALKRHTRQCEKT